MTTKTKFNSYQLRVGDYALIQEGKNRRPAEVISRGKTYLSPIGVKFADGKILYFDSRKGTDAIVGGARQVGGHWIAL